MSGFKHWNELQAAWKKLCQSQFDAKNKHGLSIGLELEFFLLDLNDLPVSLHASQLFMKELHRLFLTRGEVNIEEEMLEGEKCLSRLKCPMGKLAWNSVGYEYPPHMLEVSLSYHPSLITLQAELEAFFADALVCANKLGLKLGFQAALDERQKAAMHRIENQTQKPLRQSRLEMLQRGPYRDEVEVADFPAYMAATHVHVGGYQWWEKPGFVENLYRLEPYLMLEAKGISFKDRWSNYLKVFHDFALVGFPDTQNWTQDWWMESLFNTSYQAQKAKIENPYGLNKLRDLQVIRPRAIGTIEFRSDAAQASCDEAMRLAALRLGQFLLAQQQMPDWLPSYSVARKLWTLQMETGLDANMEFKRIILEEVKNQIRKRGFGEEVLLAPRKVEKIA